MPIYGYHCDQCGEELEVLQSMSDAPLKVCANCMGPLRKMIYPAGLIFKGSGYYTTDYKAAGSASRHGDSDAAAASDAGSKDGAADADVKVEAKSDTKGEVSSDVKGSAKSDATSPAKSSPKPSQASKPAAKEGVS